MSEKPADSAFTMLFNIEEHVIDLHQSHDSLTAPNVAEFVYGWHKFR